MKSAHSSQLTVGAQRVRGKDRIQQQNNEKAQPMANQPSMVIAPQEQEMFRGQDSNVQTPVQIPSMNTKIVPTVGDS